MSIALTAYTYRGVPTQRIFWKPNPKSMSRRKWQLRSANRYCALLFLLSRGHRSRLGLFNRCTVVSSERALCFAWFARSSGRISSWQSTQNLLFSSGRETNSLNLKKKQTYTYERFCWVIVALILFFSFSMFLFQFSVISSFCKQTCRYLIWWGVYLELYSRWLKGGILEWFWSSLARILASDIWSIN